MNTQFNSTPLSQNQIFQNPNAVAEIKPIENTITMTSIEIVAFINAFRQSTGDSTELRHDDFMRKVPKVLGENTAPKFYGTENYTNGTGGNVNRRIYNFPKREACLMAMSYSYELQAQIYDRMTALEQELLMINKPSYMIDDPIERAKKWIEECNHKAEVEAKLLEASKLIEAQAPTIDAYEMIAGKRGTLSMQQAYKYLGGIKLKEMKQWLLDKNWIYINRYDQVAIHNIYLTNGYLVQKVTQYQPQIRITYKGLVAMARQMKIKLNAEDFE